VAETVKSPPEGRVTLRNVGWEVYEMLVEEDPGRSAPRFFYDRGEMEIVSPSFEHEAIAEVAGLLVDRLAMELDVDIVGARSTTFKREDLLRGFEPDASFYFPPNAARVRGKLRISLDEGDPPPDLVIEVDITSPSSSKLPIYARLGVAEVWRHNGERVEIFTLRDGEYAEVPDSRLFAPAKVPAGQITRLIGEGLR
jgi:Uma2 family endonuclease